MSSREQFEAAVIERFKASGYLPVEIRTELLQRSGDDYHDGSVSAYWHFWQASRQALEIVLPDDGIADCERDWGVRCKDTFDCGYNYASVQHEKAIRSRGHTDNAMSRIEQAIGSPDEPHSHAAPEAPCQR